jgi:hypothetical protein
MTSTKTTLRNGLKVANFNSPHSFTFDDGSVLESVSKEFAKNTMLGSSDIEADNGKFTIVAKKFAMTDKCLTALFELTKSDADVIIAPLPVVQLINDDFANRDNKVWQELTVNDIKTLRSKVFTCFLADRVNKICSISKFCR